MAMASEAVSERDELEAELQAQLDEQQATLVAVAEALDADPSNEEMVEMQEALAAAVKETEQALMQLKRERLLRQLDAMGGGVAGGGAEQAQQAQQQQAQQQQAQQGPQWQAGQRCVFRSTDGRHYLGVVDRVEGEAVHIRFLVPTRQHQLVPLLLPASALAPSQVPPLALHQLDLGSRVVVQPPGAQLWVGAEVVGLDPAEGRVEAVTEEGSHVTVTIASVALSATVPDPWADEGSEGEGGSELSDGEGDSEGSDEDGSSASEDEDALPYGRVAQALSGAAAQVQAAAEAGPQTDTRLFCSWEHHTRGIGSKMLASMGYKGGGLGREQRGIAAPLEAAQLKRGAGLGVEPAQGLREGRKRKRKGGGKKARQKKAAKAAFDQREAGRQEQRELEARTGAEGLFAFLNSKIGDASEAAAVRRAGDGAAKAEGAAGGQGKAAQLFQGSAPKANGGADKPPDRRALASQQEQLALLRQKVSRLGEMAKRNAKDKVMLPQIRRALSEAQQQLDAAERAHSSAQQAVHQKEKEKRWLKF